MIQRKGMGAALAALGMAAILVIALSACGGGAGGPGPTESPTPGEQVGERQEPTDTPTPVSMAEATPTPTSIAETRASVTVVVTPAPDFRERVKEGRFSTDGWQTDFSLHTVPYGEIAQAAQARDGGIPAIYGPMFTTFEDADNWIAPREPILALEINGDARAYPVQILIWHEIVNDEVGGVPVLVTFCPLCNSAVVFDRRVEDSALQFGVSGNLRNSDLIMYDRETHTWWQQLTGEGIVGTHAGRRLTFLPAPMIAWEDFKASYPEGKVLSRDTGYQRDYGTQPYTNYDDPDSTPFLFRGNLDQRLPPKERVVAVTVGDEDMAFPFPVLREEMVVNYALGGRDIVVFFEPDTLSALGKPILSGADPVGSTGVFDPNLPSLDTGKSSPSGLRAGPSWITRQGVCGISWARPLRGPWQVVRLTRIVHGDHFWFAWAAFNPDTRVYQGGG